MWERFLFNSITQFLSVNSVVLMIQRLDVPCR